MRVALGERTSHHTTLLTLPPLPLSIQAYTISEKLGLIPPSVEQPEYNMFNREKVEKDYLEAGLYNYNSSNGLYGMVRVKLPVWAF